MILSILIPTVVGRELKLAYLVDEIYRQLYVLNAHGDVEVKWLSDNKELSIGEKRNLMYNRAVGEYSWMIDDDDFIHFRAIEFILKALEKKPDCIGFKELCIFDGKRVESSNFSSRYDSWRDNFDGFNHVRTIFTKSVVKTELAIQAEVPHIRFNEDEQFAINLKPFLKKEEYIDEFIYHYIYSSKEPHTEKYGIK
jgi:hypothetical protein